MRPSQDEIDNPVHFCLTEEQVLDILSGEVQRVKTTRAKVFRQDMTECLSSRRLRVIRLFGHRPATSLNAWKRKI